MDIAKWRQWNGLLDGRPKQKLLGELVSENEPLAKRFVRRLLKFTSVHVENDDIQQAALIGLMKAIQKFDPDRPTAFSTMAWWWVRDEVSHELARQQPIRWPRKSGMPYKVAAMIDTIATLEGRPAEGADFGISPELFGLWSLHARFTGVEDADGELYQSPNAEEEMAIAEFDAKLADLLEDVNPKKLTRQQIAEMREVLSDYR